MKRTTNILLTILLLGLVMACCPSCDDNKPTSDQKLNQSQEQLMQEANRQVGMPAIKNFQERKNLKMILELRDQENLVCYAYLWNEFNGKLVFLGKCIGYGIPYATEFTNPMKQEKEMFYREGYGSMSMPQADPNGLFMPVAAEGTWVMLIDPATNEPHPVYIEPRVIVSPFKLM